MKKKLISFMLALTLCYAAIPVTAFAEDTNSAPPQFVMEDVETGQKTVSLQNATEVEKVEKLDFRWEQPSVTTQYTISSTVGSGTATWTPANGSTSHTLTLHNVKINSTASYLVGVPANTNIVLDGENVLTAPGRDILVANNGDLTITGSGSLTIIGDYALKADGGVSIDIGGTLTVTGRVSSGGAISIKASDISISGMVQAANGYDVALSGTTGSVDAKMAIIGKNISVTGKKNVSVGTDYTSTYSVNSTNGIVSLTAEEGEISVVKSIQATGNDANSGSVVLSAKDNITVTGVDTAKNNNIVCNSLTLSGTIPEGSVLAANNVSGVFVPADKTLSNNGKLLVNCVTVAGTLVDSGMIVNRKNEKVIPTVTGNGVIQTPALVPALDFSNRTEDASGTGFSWDYANKTLTLTDYQLEENSTIVLPDTATLKLEGNNLLKVSGKYLIEARGKLTISGSGSLTGITDSEIGLYAAGDVTVTDCTLELTVTSSDNKSAAIQTNTHALTIDGTANVTLNAKNAAGSSGIYTGVGGPFTLGKDAVLTIRAGKGILVGMATGSDTKVRLAGTMDTSECTMMCANLLGVELDMTDSSIRMNMETGGCIELYQRKNTLTGETSVRAFEGTLKVATGDDQAINYYKVATSTSPDTPPSLGLYAAGSTVTVAAPVIPDKGIRWTAEGVTLEELEQHQVSFTMPGNPVTLTAAYHDKMEQQPLVIHAPSTVSYGDEFTLTTTGGSGSGAVSWSATGSATVDGNGKVTINGVGETTITATMAEDNDYKQAVATWTFTPQKADLSPDNYTAPVGNTGLTYNTTGQALVKAGSVVANATKMQYSLDGTTWGDTIPTGTDAKTYRVYWRVLGDANHKDFIPTEPISVTISSKVVTNPIIEVLGSYTYTGSAIEPNVTVKDGGTTIPTGEYTVSYKNNRNAGTATVTITNKNDSNYTVSGSTTFPIAKATYGDQIARGEAKYGMTGTVDLKDLILAGSTVKIGTVEDHDGVLDGTPEINGKILQFKYKNALNLAGKSAKISVSVTDCTNYLPYDITVTVTVNEKERPVVTAPTAQTLTYNGMEQILIAAGSTTGGTMQYSLDGADWSATLPTARDADTYTVYYRVVGNTDYTDVAAAQISVTVNKAVLTVTAEDKTAVVGSAIPLLTYTVSGLYGQDALTTEPMLICTPNMDKAGTYSITADSADAGRNYTIRYKAGTLTVSPWTPPVPTFPTIGNTGTPGGSSTETVTKPDGSTTITETKKDGTVTETTIRADGSTTKTETKKDGSSITENRDANGSTVTVKTDTAGKVEASATVSDEAVEDAIRENRPVTIPMEVCAEQTRENVPTIDVSIPPSVEEVKIEIPVTNANAGTVVVIVREDGTEEVVKNTVSTGNGVQVTISDPVTVKVVDNSKKFDDVSESYWGREAVDFVSSRELFSGVSETEYAPEESMTRAMLVTVLARLDGQETEGGKTWYEKSMAWATSLQITDGIAPNRAITREQLATMLYRYAGYPVASNDINGFVDSDSVSDWAVRAMQWAVETGIISGVDNLLNPQGEATRAQVAVMLMRFMEVMN